MIYLDILFLINYIYDLLLLMTVKIALKRVTKIKYLLLASLIGASSVFLLLLNINNTILFFLKITTSVIMTILSFGYKNIKYTTYNLIYLYMTSVILAGFLYYLNIEFSYKSEGLIFYFDTFSINYLLIILIGPLILYLYVYQTKKLKQKQNLSYVVKVVTKDNKNLLLDGYIDSGNKLKDPITNKYIIIVDKKIYRNKNPIYVPFKGINKSGLLECFTLKYIEINNKKFNNYLLGVSEEKINLEGSNCILNYKLMEDLNV